MKFLGYLICFLLTSPVLKSQSLLPADIFNPETLKFYVNTLASDSLMGRYTGSDGAKKAADFIAGEFKQAGLLPLAGNNGYMMPVGSNWGNVMGAIQGKTKPGQVVIFSCHYDHIGTISTNLYPEGGGKGFVEEGDTIYNGANDNISGVSAIITLARFYKQNEENNRTLIFIAFGGEEQGMLGSSYLSTQFEPDSIVTVINVEMIGRKNNGSSIPYITGHNFSSLQKILNRNLYEYDKKKYGKTFFKDDEFEQWGLFQRSDNYPFALKNVPAHTIMVSSPFDDYYHNPNDEPSSLDFKLMSHIIEAIAFSTKGLVSGKDTPVWLASFKK